jgi:hypothetical protein
LESAQGLREGLRVVAAEEAARARVVVAASVAALLSRAGRLRRSLIVGALGLLLMGLPAAILVREMQRLEGELVQARSASEDWKRRYQEAAATPPQGAVQVGPGAPSAEDVIEEQRRQFEEQLERERERRAGLERRLERAARAPRPAATVFELDTVRDVSPEGTPANRISLPKPSGRLAISLDAELLPEFPAYRVTIASADGSVIWSKGGLRPNRRRAIVVSLPGDFLDPGDYTVRLDGLPPAGPAALLARYSFRAGR